MTKSDRNTWLIYLGIGATLLVCLWFVILHPYSSSFETEITVDKATIKKIGGSDSDSYMIATESGNSYKIEDSLLHWQFSSFDLFSKIKEGQTYKIKAYGWRFGPLNWFPNIYEVGEEVVGEEVLK